MTDLRTQDEIMSSWKGDIREPLVTVRCMTYNHEPYIEDAIKGFLIQETNFPFQVLIHDDASTDNTAAIVKKYEKEYPLIIKGWYQQKNTYRLPQEKKKALRKPFYDMFIAKYQALCEGDDYWTDPNKLQMQVDFLENNPDYGMCYTKVRNYDQNKGVFLSKESGALVESFRDLFLRGNKIPTLTVCLRNDLYNRYMTEIQPSKRGWKLGDLPLWIFLIKNSKNYFFDIVTGVYRILQNSASHFSDENKRLAFVHSVFDIRFFFSELYGFKFRLYYLRGKRKAVKTYANSNVPIRFKILRFFAKTPFTFYLANLVIKFHHKIEKKIHNHKTK